MLKDWTEFKKITFSFIIWRTFLLVLIVIAPIFFNSYGSTFFATRPNEYERNPLLWAHANFDGNHYLGISTSGYGFGQQAFFPLYPFVISQTSSIFSISAPVSGIIISSIAFFLSLIVLFKLIKIDYSSSIALSTVMGILIFPTSFFFSAVYTESLFLLLIVSSFYAARTKRWILAGVLGGLASATRLIGILLLPALLIEFFEQNRDQIKTFKTKQGILRIFPILLIPSGLICFMYYLKKTTGDPLAFIHVLKYFGEFRSEKIILLYQVFWRYLKMLLLVDRSETIYPTLLLEMITGICFLITSIISFKLHRLSYSIYNFFAYLIPTLSGSFVSLPRYVLVCFPSFIIIGQLLNKNVIFRRAYFITCIISLMYLWMKFTRGYWIG